MFWAAAKSTIAPEWNAIMNEMNIVNEEAFKWFNEKPATQWTRSHFQEHAKFDILLNLCKASNASIIVAREKRIIIMLDKIRHQQMTWMNIKMEAIQR